MRTFLCVALGSLILGASCPALAQARGDALGRALTAPQPSVRTDGAALVPHEPPRRAHLGNLYGRAWSGCGFGSLIGATAGLVTSLPIGVSVGGPFPLIATSVGSLIGIAAGCVIGAGVAVAIHAEEDHAGGVPAIAHLGTWMGPVAGMLLGLAFTLPLGENVWHVGMVAGALGGAAVLSQLGAILAFALTRDPSPAVVLSVSPIEDGAVGLVGGRL